MRCPAAGRTPWAPAAGYRSLSPPRRCEKNAWLFDELEGSPAAICTPPLGRTCSLDVVFDTAPPLRPENPVNWSKFAQAATSPPSAPTSAEDFPPPAVRPARKRLATRYTELHADRSGAAARRRGGALPATGPPAALNLLLEVRPLPAAATHR